MISETTTVVDRLRAATNAHDLDAIVGCFSETYRNETPIHPGRGFTGRSQVRANWQHILKAVPDVIAEVTREVVAGAVIWSEWEMRGTRPDGQPHLMRGVIIFGIANDVIDWARFYLEPVDDGHEGAEMAVQRIVGRQ
ncbi:MAG: nuclear transport factor 2 family protein [Ilumatobacteraceae bacterium]